MKNISMMVPKIAWKNKYQINSSHCSQRQGKGSDTENFIFLDCTFQSLDFYTEHYYVVTGGVERQDIFYEHLI